MSRNADGLGRKPHKWRGRWRAYLTNGYEPSGKPIRTYVYGRTQAECQEKLDEARKQHKAGVAARKGPITVDRYLDDWLKHKALQVKPRTVEIYRAELAHARPHIGRRQLARLTPKHVQDMMAAIVGSQVTYTYHRRPAEEGQPAREYKRTVTLTARAANETKSILANAFDDAMTQGLMSHNPARVVKALRHEEAELTVWSAEEIAAFTKATLEGKCPHHALFYLALTTGMRAGELIALERKDLRGDRLKVERTASTKGTVGSPKSKAARRVLALPPDTVATLKAHMAAVDDLGIRSTLLFPSASGSMLQHTNLLKSLRAWARKAKVTEIRVHDLRHTFASMAIAAGMHAAELARILGHADPSFTMKTYVHFFELARPRSAPTLAELMGSENRKGVFPGGTEPESG